MKLSKPPFAPIPDDDALRAAVEQQGLPSLVRPVQKTLLPTSPESPVDEEPEADSPRSRRPAAKRKQAPARITIEVPEYVAEQLAIKAAREKASAGYFILMGLKATGFKVHDDDLVPDRRRRR